MLYRKVNLIMATAIQRHLVIQTWSSAITQLQTLIHTDLYKNTHYIKKQIYISPINYINKLYLHLRILLLMYDYVSQKPFP